MNFSTAVIHEKPRTTGGFLCGKFLQFVLKDNKEGHRAFHGNLGKGEQAPYRSTAFHRKGGVEGIGILGAIVKQTNQKKKGEWMNG